jgi:hypothetical protein
VVANRAPQFPLRISKRRTALTPLRPAARRCRCRFQRHPLVRPDRRCYARSRVPMLPEGRRGEQPRDPGALVPVADGHQGTPMQSSTVDVDSDHPNVIDEIVSLREWGTNTVYALPAVFASVSRFELRVGNLTDHAGESRTRLIHSRGKWLLENVVTGGTAIDREVVLEPGAEVRIGQRAFIAESIRSILLRRFMCRLLGWSPGQSTRVDDALRSIRTSVLHRTPLVPCGETDVAPIARSIHRRVLGIGCPFIMCDPRQRPREESARLAENCRTGADAVDSANGGTVCLRSQWLPRDEELIFAALQDPCRQLCVMVCSALQKPRCLVANQIVIPPLRSRMDELDRIIDEYVSDAAADLSIDSRIFLPEDRQWVRDNDSASLARVQRATRYTLALRASSNVSVAATCLEMTSTSLLNWLKRRATWPGRLSMSRLRQSDHAQRFLRDYRNDE